MEIIYIVWLMGVGIINYAYSQSDASQNEGASVFILSSEEGASELFNVTHKNPPSSCREEPPGRCIQAQGGDELRPKGSL